MTKISIEVIDMSRQISLVNRSRDHSTIIETYLQYFITNTTKISINENLQILTIFLVPLQRKFITFSVAFYLVKIHKVFSDIVILVMQMETQNSPIFANHVHLFMCCPRFVYTLRTELPIGSFAAILYTQYLLILFWWYLLQ